MRLKKLKELTLALISIILTLYIVKYLKIISIIKTIFTVLIPLFIGFAYAWFINPFIKKLAKNHPRNIVSISFFLIIIILISALLYCIIPIIYKEISEILKILPIIFAKIKNNINNMGLNAYLDRILNFLLSALPNFILTIIKNTFKYLGVIGIGLILGLYISIDYPQIIKKIVHAIPKKHKCFITGIIAKASDEVRKCIHGTLLIALFVFLADSILFALIKLDAPLIFGLICGLTDLIPYVGPYIGGFIAIAVGFTKSKITGILAIIICIVVQSIENYVLQPVIMSKTIKISPVLIITGLLIFGHFFGIIGLLISTPCVAIIRIICENIKPILEKCRE